VPSEFYAETRSVKEGDILFPQKEGSFRRTKGKGVSPKGGIFPTERGFSQRRGV